MKTIEAIRMANYRSIVAELRGDQDSIRPVDISRALGISNVYAWQLEKGKRTAIDSKAARLIERKVGKPEGWLDTDFEQWPFPDASLLERVEQLNEAQRIEVQGAIRQALAAFQTATESGKSDDSRQAAKRHGRA